MIVKMSKSKIKTLQELFLTRRTFIQLGKKKYIVWKKNIPIKDAKFFQKLQRKSKIKVLIVKNTTGDTADLLVPENPSYLYINDELEVWSDNGFQFKMEPNGTVSFISGDSKNQELLDFCEQQKISEIQIQNNLIWVWKKGEPQKLFYYAMNDRVIKDATTYEKVEYISEVPRLE